MKYRHLKASGVSRRGFLAALLSGAAGAVTFALSGAGIVLAAETPIELSWNDLIPESQGQRPQIPSGIIQHGQMSTPTDKSEARVTYAYNGKTVRIPGYIVPLELDGTGTREFLLVPYVGACIHVPPPPANQLVIVTAEEPYEYRFMFEPVYVTGTLNTSAVATELAEVGYALAADKVEPYE